MATRGQTAGTAAIEDCPFLETRNGLKYLPPHREAAWLGLLKAHAELTRGLDAELSARHGLSLSAYEVLARLARSEGGDQRMSQIAEQSQLSLSRVSRIIDHLEGRGLAVRASCETDSRVVYAKITPAGRGLISAAQETFFEVIEERFMGRLTCSEIELLGGVFARLVGDGDGARDC